MPITNLPGHMSGDCAPWLKRTAQWTLLAIWYGAIWLVASIASAVPMFLMLPDSSMTRSIWCAAILTLICIVRWLYKRRRILEQRFAAGDINVAVATGNYEGWGILLGFLASPVLMFEALSMGERLCRTLEVARPAEDQAAIVCYVICGFLAATTCGMIGGRYGGRRAAAYCLVTGLAGLIALAYYFGLQLGPYHYINPRSSLAGDLCITALPLLWASGLTVVGNLLYAHSSAARPPWAAQTGGQASTGPVASVGSITGGYSNPWP